MENNFETIPPLKNIEFKKVEKSQIKLDSKFKQLLIKKANLLTSYIQTQRISFGPTYSINSSNGDKFNVEVYIINTFYNSFPRYLFLAKDENQYTLGIREQRVEDNDATGSIMTGVRGRGISTVIDIALQDLLQREINKRKISLNWVIVDGNSTDLKNLKDTKGFSKDPNLEQKIFDKDLDRKRWKHLYWHDGLFGFDKKGVKILEPKPGTNNDIQSIKSIIIKRTENNPLGEVENIELVADEDVDAYTKQRKEDLLKTIERMKELAG